jgi:putative nucleotidyltransferase with HDIG domain
MKDKLNIVFKLQSQIYKFILFLFSVALIVYLIPKNSKFQYEFEEGKPWKYETLLSPFDFSIEKSVTEIELEKLNVSNQSIRYFKKSTITSDSIINSIVLNIKEKIPYLYDEVIQRLDKVYFPGLVSDFVNFNNDSVYITSSDSKFKTRFNELNKVDDFNFDSISYKTSTDSILFDSIIKFSLLPNLIFDELKTDLNKTSLLGKISFFKGFVNSGERIISRGEIVDSEKLSVLKSLKSKFESQIWSKSNYNWIIIGYSIIVGTILFFLLLFLRKNRLNIYLDNTKLTFIFLIILIFVTISIFVYKFQPFYIYVVPLCSIPLLIRAFFDSRLGLFVHVLTLLVLGFIVPDSFQFLFLHTIAGIITILTPSDLYQRANLFISVSIITGIYIISYFSITIIINGNISDVSLNIPLLFVFNGLATLFVHPLIYIFEKIFGLVSDVSLLELTNTNSPLLKDLSEKAPGTFYHSLAVSNLAEAVAVQISANVMLVRVGALYHDIGKMKKNHISIGIELAKKNQLPDRVIDFIRTHHGTSIIRFFYDKEMKNNTKAIVSDFRYLGPKPFSKETAIVMMADSVEAASKSIKDPNVKLINDFVEKIIDKQIEDNQFIDSDITLKEIQIAKKIFKEKLNNIYHLRVEYPD